MKNLKGLGILTALCSLFTMKHNGADGAATNGLVKFTAIVDSISGKIAGSVFARNKGGNYVRGKGKPTNPNTAAQSGVRSIFGTISQAWRNLTQEQRKQWENAVDDYPYQNRLGETKTLSGSGLHQKLNLNLSAAGANFIDAPLLPAKFAQPLAISADIDGTTPEILISAAFDEQPDANTSIIVYMTESSSAGRTNLKNRLRKVGAYPANTIGNLDITADYQAIFGNPIVGAKIGIEMRAVNTNTGQGGAALYDVVTVVA